MTLLPDLSFWFAIPWYIVSIFLAFYIPGRILLWRLPVSPVQRFFLSLGVGLVLWGYQGFLFGYLQIRFMTYLYLLIFTLLWIWKFAPNFTWESFSRFRLKNLDKGIVLIASIGILFQMSTVWLMGAVYNDGLYFCCGFPDNAFHLALTNELVKHFPPFEPALSSVVVQNYHYFSNLIVAELVRIFTLPLVYTHFQFSAFLLAILTTAYIIIFSQIHGLSKKYTRWVLFFLFFSGDIIYLFLLLLGKEFNLHIAFLYNPMHAWASPPRVFGTAVFFLGLCLLSLWIKKKTVYDAILISAILASLIAFKVYLGIFALFGLGMLLLYYFFVKRNHRVVIPFLLSFLFSLLLYFPINKNSGGLFFTGFWRFEDFIVYPPFGLANMELTRKVYEDHHNWLRVMQYEVLYIGLYFLIIFGTLIGSIFNTRKSLSGIPREVHIFLLSGIAISFILGSFFYQKIGGANTSQFFIQFFAILPLYAALSYTHWFGKVKKPFVYMLIIVVVLLTIPRVGHDGYYQVKRLLQRQGFLVTNEQLAAVSFLKEKVHDNEQIMIERHIFNGEEITYLISFYTGKQIYVGETRILNDHGASTIEREKLADTILKSDSASSISAALIKTPIDYMYLTNNHPRISTRSAYFLKEVFRNNQALILKADRQAAKEYTEMVKRNKIHE